MHLRFTTPFEVGAAADASLEGLPACSAVFALFPTPREGVPSAPYLGRTRDLRRRLARLLSARRPISKMLNLRELTARVEYEPVGSAFEGTWLLYLLNRHFFSRQYRDRMRLKPPALLKLKMQNRFPRCYPTRRMAKDRSIYYGPFPSMAVAERFAGEFLDFFKIRRCVEELNPDPSHPGCIYSQLHMCLAPCFAGCTDAEYQGEVQRVVEFLDSQGKSLQRALEAERAQASESLEFEQASKIHHRIEKLNEVLRQRSDLVRNLRDLHAVMVLPGAEAKSVVFFRIMAGEIRGPSALSLDENVPNPTPLDRQLHDLMESLAGEASRVVPPSFPPWEHLSLLARWYYSSFRQGELVMLNPDQTIPHSRLIRICRKVLAHDGEATAKEG
ncbi:MAG TPA: UvrB/UvrC motif-containing protein [Terriglobia bacterium]|nr:UvrB/UvrC motif-containing protein [Terriglobia bacterium]